MKSFFIALLVVLGTFLQVHAQKSYDYRSVKIGGGGYITGMKIHPQNPNLQYIRTDVGGAYRWNNTTKTMEQLLNFAGTKSSYYGVAGMALHPTKQNIIYLAVDRGNSTKTSNILYSKNKGKDWTVIDVPEGVKFGANGGRENSQSNDTDREGSPLIINPKNTNELWVGSREGGLWVLDLTQNDIWRKIDDIPNNSEEQSIRSVLFHPKFDHVIFVGYFGKGIYRSTNSGRSFSLINSAIDDLKQIADMSLSKNGDKLYVAVRNEGIYRLDNPTLNDPLNATKLNLPFANIYRGYQTVSASPHDNNLVMASVASPGGNNLARFQVSTNSGDSWITKSETTIENNFPWKNVVRSAGAHTSQITFDPNDPDKLYWTSFFGIWHTDNWNQDRIAWSNYRTRGVEEIVPTGLYSFPENTSGNVIGVNSADYPGIISKDTDSYENKDILEILEDTNGIGKGVSVVACERYPNNFIISTTRFWKSGPSIPNEGYLVATNNGGKNYHKLSGYKKEWMRSLVAIAANDPSNIVAVHGNEIHYTKDAGKTFKKANISGLGNVVINNVFRLHRPLVHDFSNSNGPKRFFLYDWTKGTVYRSSNGGKDWSIMGTLPSGAETNEFTSSSLKATPGKPGHLWFNHPEKGLYRSTNGGKNWIRIAKVKSAQNMSLGKAVNDTGYPAIYIVGSSTFNSELGVYRSIDEGENWEKINNASQTFLSYAKFIEADRSVFGKVYLGIGGLGVYEGVPTKKNNAALKPSQKFIEQKDSNTLKMLNLYPNPAKNEVFFKAVADPNNYTFKLYDLQGQLVKFLDTEANKTKLLTSDLDSGTYLLLRQNILTNERKSAKLIIE